jgi:phosphate transport system substrate-binding protein
MSVNYQSVGSGAGIGQLMAGVVDFGASDMPMTDEQLAAMKSAGLQSGLKSNVLHFPTVMGGVVPIYNLGSREYRLKFTPEILAGIFMGKITKWNDPRICEVNPGVELPPETIRPIHRSDSSGTTFVFTDFLSKTVPEWKTGVGSGTMVKWLGGEGEKGSEGAAGRTRHSVGSIGYVDLAYALRNALAYGSVRNASGAFVLADMKGVTAESFTDASALGSDKGTGGMRSARLRAAASRRGAERVAPDRFDPLTSLPGDSIIFTRTRQMPHASDPGQSIEQPPYQYTRPPGTRGFSRVIRPNQKIPQ